MTNDKVVNQLFKKFIQENNLKPKGDFKNQTITYWLPSGDGNVGYFREQLLNSVAFAGFIDGYLSNPQRGKGRPRAMPDRIPEGENLGQAVKAALEEAGIGEVWRGFFAEQIEFKIDGHPRFNYEEQFYIGAAARCA